MRVVHVNHNIDAASDGLAQKLCETLCGQMNLPLCVEHIHVKDLPGNLEKNARTARYAQLQKHGSLIVTAHHLDDRIENLLMKITRGSSLSALISMGQETNFSQYTVYRPLHGVEKSQLKRYCDEHKLPYVFDPMNLDSDYSRVFFRFLIQKIAQRFPNLHHNLRHLFRNLEYADSVLNKYLDRDLLSLEQNQDGIRYMSISTLRQYDRSHLSLLLKRFFDNNRVLISASHFNVFLDNIYRTDLQYGKISFVFGNLTINQSADKLRISTNNRPRSFN
jgi:tRNA(Ile)-lysidine synthetase-like protein